MTTLYRLHSLQRSDVLDAYLTAEEVARAWERTDQRTEAEAVRLRQFTVTIQARGEQFRLHLAALNPVPAEVPGLGWAPTALELAARASHHLTRWMAGTGRFDGPTFDAQRLAAWVRLERDRLLASVFIEAGTGSSQDVSPPVRRNHSMDYRRVEWDGDRYSFSPKQAAVVQRLWQAAEANPHNRAVGTATLLTVAGGRTQKLRDLFKKGRDYHPAWGRLIVKAAEQSSGGMYQLCSPPMSDAS